MAMLVRFVIYRKHKYLLFMLDMCYFINLFTLVFVWGLPWCVEVQAVQFGLANGHAYAGTFLFRNALVLHDFQKITSCFIHALPTFFSFCIRWFPNKTSEWWYTDFIDNHADRGIFKWNYDLRWIWLVGVPVLCFIVREVLYYTIIYGCVKPGEKHLDSFRYVSKKVPFFVHFLKFFPKRLRLPAWMALNVFLGTCMLLLAVVAWCSYLFHLLLLVVQVMTFFWNSASYYLDYLPLELTRGMEVVKPELQGLLVTPHSPTITTATASSCENGLLVKMHSPVNDVSSFLADTPIVAASTRASYSLHNPLEVLADETSTQQPAV